jgi:hypothetical protein
MNEEKKDTKSRLEAIAAAALTAAEEATARGDFRGAARALMVLQQARSANHPSYTTTRS